MRGQSVILKPVGALGQQWSEAVGAQLGLISVLTEAAHRFMHRDAAHDSEDQQAKVVILNRMHYAHIHSTVQVYVPLNCKYSMCKLQSV